MRITKVKPNSLAEQIDLKPGDRLLKINGKKVVDDIDYRYKITDELVKLEIEINGERHHFEVEKEYDDDLGV